MITHELYNQSEFCLEIEAAGYAIATKIATDDQLSAITIELEGFSVQQSHRRGAMYAMRNLLRLSSVRALADSQEIRSLVDSILGPDAFPVRGILFDKVAGANWHVGWHQDQVIPVAERKEVPGFSAWSVKHGVPHVCPPATILARMLTLRVHLDNCAHDNGALKVIPGTHKLGLLHENEIPTVAAKGHIVLCEAERCSVLAMRPLLLHASSPATSPLHRRVVHLEFAAEALPGGLEWPRWS